MPDDSNSVDRQQVFRQDRGKIDAERNKSEKIEHKVMENEAKEKSPQRPS